MTKYIIRAALHDEANEGWVWTRKFGSRSVVKITNTENCRSVYCQVRKIDVNFENEYEKDPQRIPLTDADTVVMSQWYRDALGGFTTTQKDNETGLVDLKIKPLSGPCRWWGSLRAAAHHPDIVVRIGLTLGVLGAILGVVSLIPTLLASLETCVTGNPKSGHWIFVLVLISILLGYFICKRPTSIK